MNNKHHPCPSWDGCSSAYCPSTQQGLHVDGDEVCHKVGRKYAMEFHQRNTGITSGQAMQIIQLRYDRLHIIDHPCDKYADCSAPYCPATKEGEHKRNAPVCSRLPRKWIEDFPKNYKGASMVEVVEAVQKTFDKHQQTSQ